ncbi:MAG: primase-helicase zinc-binding domain-containing protein [Methylicorpusculum sp.]|uniref:DUF7146 domain-containing protein n=1 Tax=Methylicorpusculum sp. TaxID=2713644 RepID=UPI0027312CCE|nr:primase-helicase zinc-binding domain-containing protein [Methylicorpusculum sp.]MDP2203320.1 primase-helicase zinc-binding domain-containing protein [Methylicorpusculum sp.]
MNTSTLKSHRVRDSARGDWLSVLDALAPELQIAIDKPGRHMACPVHGGKDGFRLFRDANLSGGGVCNTCGFKPDGFSLLMWLRDWSFPEALSAVANELGLLTDSNHKKPVVRRKPFDHSKSVVDDEQLKVIFRKILQGSKPISHASSEPVRLYLQSRGLDSAIPDWPAIRFHPNMQFKDEDGNVIGHFPAMLALVENGNELITIHRTFLTQEGCKAPVDSPKKIMPVPSNKLFAGSAVRLGWPGRVLGVTEGIETAFAVIEATGMVTWPLISSSIMPQFSIPMGVEKLIIWSDLDRLFVGSFAAQKLAECAEAQGIEVVIHEPKGPLPADVKSIDWLDVFNEVGPNAFALRSCSSL